MKIREGCEMMEEYFHGGDIYSQETELDYSANISPLGLPEGVKKAVIQKLDSFCVYPDPQCRSLKKTLGDYYGIDQEHIICGNGAADLIFQLVWSLRPKKALLTAPTFQEYERALKTIGTEILYCYLDPAQGFFLDRRKWEDMTESVDIAFLCNPNNPTGIPVPKEDVIHMAEICRKKGIFLAVDECFTDFLEEPEKYSVLKEEGEKNHIFILKAFTKLYAMAGFRLGYGVCGNKDLLSAMERGRQPWSVSAIAQTAGEAALKENVYVENVRALINKEREFLKKGLKALGFQVFDSKANYIFFYVPKDGKGEDSLFSKMKDRKILIRPCGNFSGLGEGYYRICVKDRKSNEKLLAVMEDVR